MTMLPRLWLFLLLSIATASSAFMVIKKHPKQRRAVLYSSKDDEIEIPAVVESPLLRKLYPALIRHQQECGNPNIPLGTSEGRQCQTLRRLQTQQKLTSEEVELLTNMDFRFHSLEDVYHEVDFHELFERLLSHEEEFRDEGYQIPKKFARDPELGAWVTGLRRLGPSQVQPEHAQKLEEIGFDWKSNRKCGSAFMKQFREIRDRVQSEGEAILKTDGSIRTWVRAQIDADRRGTLSETRNHYMMQLFGEDWKSTVLLGTENEK